MIVTGSITAQTLVVQTITSSVDFVTGSTRFGSLLDNTHVFSGSVSMNPGGLFVSSSGLVGIGTTSPSSKLHVVGSSLTDTFRITDASNYTIVMGYSGSANVGMISTLGGTAKLALGTNSAARLTIDGTGNVGIGTSTPLDTYGGRTVLTINNNGLYGAFLNFGYNGSLYGFIQQQTDILQIGSQANIPLAFYSNAVERLRLTTAGKVTIPSGANGTSYFSMNYTSSNAGSREWAIGSDTAGWGSFSIGQATTQGGSTFSDKLVISSTGAATFSGNALTVSGPNPAITATTSDASLYAYIALTGGTSSNYIYTLSNSYATTGPYIAGALTLVGSTSGGISLSAGHASGEVRLYSGGGNERMRITSAGYAKISNTGNYQNASGPYAEVVTSANNNLIMALMHSTSTYPYGVSIYFSGASPNDTTRYFLLAEDTTNQKAAIYSNGTFGSRTGTYGSIISDVKYKQDITDASSQWDDIKNLKVRNFKYKEDVQNEGDNALRQIGFIAQEVEQVSPGLVYTAGKKDSDETWKSVKTSIIEIKAIKALQEAMAKIEELEEKLERNNII